MTKGNLLKLLENLEEDDLIIVNRRFLKQGLLFDRFVEPEIEMNKVSQFYDKSYKPHIITDKIVEPGNNLKTCLIFA